MSVYTVALFVHILGVLTLFIGIAAAWTTLRRLRRAKTMTHVHEEVRHLGVQLRFPPLGLAAILLAGAYMATTAWGWDTPWIDVALVAFVCIGGLGGGLIDRRLSAIQRAALAVDADAAIPHALRRQMSDPILRAALWVAAMLAVGVVFLMTNKPGWSVSLLTLAVAAALGAGLALTGRRG